MAHSLSSVGPTLQWRWFVLLMVLVPGLTTATGADSPSNQTTSPTGIQMIRIPAGNFIMGSPPDEPGRAEVELQHKVTLSRDYWFGVTEVTQSQWLAVMGTTPAKIKGDENPVEQVSWFDCVSFCNALSAKEGLTPVYEISGKDVSWNQSADGYRLPTEAEWEYACRAGTTGERSGDLDEMAIYSLNSGRKTRTVGTRVPNPWGLHDIYGNVWEWCWDKYSPYEAGPVTDPAGPVGDYYRIQRGGSWHRGPRDCRSASRGTDPATARRNALGMRLARWAQ